MTYFTFLQFIFHYSSHNIACLHSKWAKNATYRVWTHILQLNFKHVVFFKVSYIMEMLSLQKLSEKGLDLQCATPYNEKSEMDIHKQSAHRWPDLKSTQIRNDIHSKLGWKPLYVRRALYDLSFFYKVRNGFICIPFPVEVQPSYMYNSKYQHIQALHAENYKNSFFPRTVRLWNALPTSCHSATSITIFNSQCRSWLAPKTWGRVNGVFKPL